MSASEPTRDELLQRELHRIALRMVLAEALRHRVRVVPVLIAALLLIGLASFTADAWLGPNGAYHLQLAGALMPVRVLQGEWWRLFTGPMLHADWAHLMLNLVALYVVGRPIEAAFGPARFWLIYAGAGLAGALATVTSSVPLPVEGPVAAFTARMALAPMSVGASGSIFGLIAAMIALGLKLWPQLTPGLRKSLVHMPVVLLLAMLVVGSLQPHVDTMAHLGGATGGLMLGMVLRPQLHGFGRDTRAWSAWARPLAWVCAGLALAALALSALRVGKPIELPAVRVTAFSDDFLQASWPTDLPRGVLRQGRCQQQYLDPAWALKTDRMPCWILPVNGDLILGRRDRLLDLDAGDLQALRKANASGHFQWRQPGVMVYPLGDRWLWVLHASEAMLASHAKALQPLLPAPNLAQVATPQPGDPPWTERLQPPPGT